MNIFIADDHPVITQGLSGMLARQDDLEVCGTAASTDALFAELANVQPNLLFLDLNMPGEDYTRTINLLKEQYPWIKLIAYTQYETHDLIRTLFKAGVHGYLHKSSGPDEILEAVETVHQGERFISRRFRQSDNETIPSESPAAIVDDFRKRLGLSKREQQIVRLISRGLTSLNISKELFISKHTVETHRKNILRKLNLNSSKELVRFAVMQGLS